MPQNTRKSTIKPKGEPLKKKATSSIDIFFYNLQQKIEKNQKAVLTVIVAVAIVVGGYFGYKYLIVAPKEEKAATALSYVQQWFEIDSFKLTLNGNGLNGGALDVIRRFDGTASANLAHFYAGISYLNLNDPQNAIKQLSQFDGKGTPVEFMAYGAMGDAYMDSKNVAKGIEYYKKAASDKKNQFIAPLYLFRAGLACELNGKKEEAKKFYQEIKTEYPYSQQGQNIDKYLARLGEVPID